MPSRMAAAAARVSGVSPSRAAWLSCRAGVLLLLLKAQPGAGGPGFQTGYLAGGSGDARQLAGDVFLLVIAEGGACGAQLRVPVARGCCLLVAVPEVAQGLVQVAGLLLGLLGGCGGGSSGSGGVIQQAAADQLGLVGQLGELVMVLAGPLAHDLQRLDAEDALEHSGALGAGRCQQPVELALREQDGALEAVDSPGPAAPRSCG